jgi:hypothetical protein
MKSVGRLFNKRCAVLQEEWLQGNKQARYKSYVSFALNLLLHTFIYHESLEIFFPLVQNGMPCMSPVIF